MEARRIKCGEGKPTFVKLTHSLVQHVHPKPNHARHTPLSLSCVRAVVSSCWMTAMHVTLQGCAEAFFNGLATVLPKCLLQTLWRPQDLRRVLCGPDTIDVAAIREGAAYEGVRALRLARPH